MNGDRIVVDTSLIINLFNGVREVHELINGRELLVSVISEIEVLSFPKITPKDFLLLKEFLAECFIVDIEPTIKDITIDIRSKYRIKLPDSVIAATAIYFDLPLFTMDKDFKKIADCKSVILSV